MICATEREARPIISDLSAGRIPADGYDLYRGVGGALVAVCPEMGPRAAATTLRRLLGDHAPSSIWNVGIAGCLNDRFQVGDLVLISEVRFGGRSYETGFSNSSRHRLLPCCPTGRLITSLEPVFDDQLRQELSAHGDLVDMEAGALARELSRLDRPPEFFAIKGISDFAGEGERSRLHANLERVCRKLSDLLCEVIER